MAGHSAGAIISLVYISHTLNADGDIRAAGNWAGTSDFSQWGDTSALTQYLDQAGINHFKELSFRWVGYENDDAHALYWMAVTPYWITSRNGGRPVISVMPELNDPFPRNHAASSLRNVLSYHRLLSDQGVSNVYVEIQGENHGYAALPDSRRKLINYTAAFFKSH